MLGSTLAEPVGGNNVNESLRQALFGELVHAPSKPLICRQERARQVLKPQRLLDIQLWILGTLMSTNQEHFLCFGDDQ